MTAGDAIVEEVDVLVFEFDNFSAIDADEVVVGGFVDEVGVVGFLISAEVDFAQQAGFEEDFDGAIDRGAGGGEVFAACALVEFFVGKVLILGKDESHDCFALGRAAHFFLTNECVELIDNGVLHEWEFKAGVWVRESFFWDCWWFRIGKRGDCVFLVRMKHWYLILIAGVMVGCGPSPELEVFPMHLRSIEVADEGAMMVRAEQLRKFYGAVGVRDRELRLGHYYAVDWRNDDVGEPVRVKFEYQQGGTGSRVLVMEDEFDSSLTEGRAEFRIVGKDYLEGGKVLAWKCGLWRGDDEVASQASYLWRDGP